MGVGVGSKPSWSSPAGLGFRPAPSPLSPTKIKTSEIAHIQDYQLLSPDIVLYSYTLIFIASFVNSVSKQTSVTIVA